MKSNKKVIIGSGIFFGFIAFIITIFLFPPIFAFAIGLFAAILSVLVFSVVINRNAKKYENTDALIEGDILLKDTANYYFGKLILNGLLYLTADRLIFISYEKKPVYRDEILLSDIKSATYGKIFKHIQGLKLIMNDLGSKGFVLKDIELFLKAINKTV